MDMDNMDGMDMPGNKPDGDGMSFMFGVKVTWFLTSLKSVDTKGYIGGLVFMIFLCLIYEFSAWLNRFLEDRYVTKKRNLGKKAVIPLYYYFAMPCSYAVKQTTGYMLMLLIMTFNVVLCVVLVLA